MPRNDWEVFEQLTEADGTSDEIDFITYAMFAYQKKAWIEHYHEKMGHLPDQPAIDDWISNITDLQFSTMRSLATNLFDDAARKYLKDEIESEKREILEAAIVKEVAAAGAFPKQLAVALLTSILAPLILGGMIAASLVWEKYAAPSQISSRLVPGTMNPADAK